MSGAYDVAVRSTMRALAFLELLYFLNDALGKIKLRFPLLAVAIKASKRSALVYPVFSLLACELRCWLVFIVGLEHALEHVVSVLFMIYDAEQFARPFLSHKPTFDSKALFGNLLAAFVGELLVAIQPLFPNEPHDFCLP